MYHKEHAVSTTEQTLQKKCLSVTQEILKNKYHRVLKRHNIFEVLAYYDTRLVGIYTYHTYIRSCSPTVFL
jgi:hypothetical protein